MSALIPFDFETNAVRVVMVEGAPWFVAADVCRVLEHTNPTVALRRLDPDEQQQANLNTLNSAYGIQPPARGNPNAALVSESGLFALILTSNKPAAKRFRRWVTGEVLPALRREGSYALPGADRDDLAAKRRYFAALPEAHRSLAEARAAALDAVEARIAQGARTGAALEAVAAGTGIGARTLYSLRAWVWMVPRRDWPAALAPKWSGERRMLAECHPAALARLRALAGAGLRVSVAIAQVRAEAGAAGWHPIPCDRTLRRAVARADHSLTQVEAA